MNNIFFTFISRDKSKPINWLHAKFHEINNFVHIHHMSFSTQTVSLVYYIFLCEHLVVLHYGPFFSFFGSTFSDTSKLRKVNNLMMSQAYVCDVHKYNTMQLVYNMRIGNAHVRDVQKQLVYSMKVYLAHVQYVQKQRGIQCIDRSCTRTRYTGVAALQYDVNHAFMMAVHVKSRNFE